MDAIDGTRPGSNGWGGRGACCKQGRLHALVLYVSLLHRGALTLLGPGVPGLNFSISTQDGKVPERLRG